MKNNKNYFILFILFLIPSEFSHAVKCTRPTIGFFNGMLNNSKAASDNFAALKNNLVGENEVFTKYKLPFNYILFYNNTEGISKDINEVFRQLKQEEESGTLALDARTKEDYKNHEMFAADALNHGMGLILVGHSQGNFFLNHIYEYCVRNARSVPCRAIHIGSPSSKNNGEYFLSNNDKIIQAFFTVTRREFNPNINIPFNITEPTGHSFISTYLDSKKPAEEKIIRSIDTALYDFCPFM